MRGEVADCGQSQSAWVESSTQQGQAWDLGKGWGPGDPAPSPETPSASREAATLQTPTALCLALHLSLSSQRGNSPVILDGIAFCQIRWHLTHGSLFFLTTHMWNLNSHVFSCSVRSDLVTPWTEDARLFYLLEFAQTMSIESLMPSHHFYPLSSPPLFLLPDQGSNLDPCFEAQNLNH